MQETPKRLLRVAGTPARELGLLARGVSDDQIIDAMVQHPNLVNRPIVVTALGTVLARPPMRALSVLPKGCVGLPFDAKP